MKKMLVCLFALFCVFSYSAFSQDIVVFDQKSEDEKVFVQNAFRFMNEFDPSAEEPESEDILSSAKEFFSTESERGPIESTMQMSFAAIYDSFYAKKLGKTAFNEKIQQLQGSFLESNSKTLRTLVTFDSDSNLSIIKSRKLLALEKAESISLSLSDYSEEQLINLFNKLPTLYVIMTNPDYQNVRNAFFHAISSYFDQDSAKFIKNFDRNAFLLYPPEFFEFYNNLSQDDYDSKRALRYKFSTTFLELYNYAESKDLCFMDFFLDEETTLLQKVLDDAFVVILFTEDQLSYFTNRFEDAIYIIKECEGVRE